MNTDTLDLCNQKDNYARCLNSAIYSLAIREHSRLELYNKLKKKDYSKNIDLNILLDELEENDYLNEKRFIDSFIRSRIERGQGSNKISYELKKRGIESTLIGTALNSSSIDWLNLASQQRIKKFGNTLPDDYKIKAKQMRFLSARGFNSEIIRSIFN